MPNPASFKGFAIAVLIIAAPDYVMFVRENGPTTPYPPQVFEGVTIDTSSGFGAEHARYSKHPKDILTVFGAVQLALRTLKEDYGILVPTPKIVQEHVALILARSAWASGFSRSGHALVYLIGTIALALYQFDLEEIKDLKDQGPEHKQKEEALTNVVEGLKQELTRERERTRAQKRRADEEAQISAMTTVKCAVKLEVARRFFDFLKEANVDSDLTLSHEANAQKFLSGLVTEPADKLNNAPSTKRQCNLENNPAPAPAEHPDATFILQDNLSLFYSQQEQVEPADKWNNAPPPKRQRNVEKNSAPAPAENSDETFILQDNLSLLYAQQQQQQFGKVSSTPSHCRMIGRLSECS